MNSRHNHNAHCTIMGEKGVDKEGRSQPTQPRKEGMLILLPRSSAISSFLSQLLFLPSSSPNLSTIFNKCRQALLLRMSNHLYYGLSKTFSSSSSYMPFLTPFRAVILVFFC